MNEEKKSLDVFGAWLIVAGTMLNASRETIALTGAEQAALRATGAGNAVEASGNALQAAVRSGDPANRLSALGAWVQSAGNTANAAARIPLLSGDLQEGYQLDVLGNAVQSIGAATEAIASSSAQDRLFREQLTAGYLLIAGGAVIDAISGVYFLKELSQRGRALGWFGGYLQATGALLAADALTNEP
ncbi:hypothetical protein [Metabacillus sp. cB07]|uniref:DUF6944 family repetitive protein n=1 Tax=Metabacillus sp. cB07 TaxID=2806989 RepID=UPI001939E192|nr:hypothetical protein [Metabacillus sp. cB07]